ncbi:MAG: type II toxin-antitoxin system HicA family toxin [Holophagaceae bacterium]|nr:type II toxin-antitoxin system HicA family toxin [Holophagaceae bacterium]
MSKHQKLLEKICFSPTPADIKWQELQTALERLGYQMLKNSGSRRKFYHRGKDALFICHQPHPSPNVDKGCIADLADHLRTHGFI